MPAKRGGAHNSALQLPYRLYAGSTDMTCADEARGRRSRLPPGSSALVAQATWARFGIPSSRVIAPLTPPAADVCRGPLADQPLRILTRAPC